MLTRPEQSSPVQKERMKWSTSHDNRLFPSFNPVCMSKQRCDNVGATQWHLETFWTSIKRHNLTWMFFSTLFRQNEPIWSVLSYVLTERLLGIFNLTKRNNPQACFFTDFSCGLFGLTLNGKFLIAPPSNEKKSSYTNISDKYGTWQCILWQHLTTYYTSTCSGDFSSYYC